MHLFMVYFYHLQPTFSMVEGDGYSAARPSCGHGCTALYLGPFFQNALFNPRYEKTAGWSDHASLKRDLAIFSLHHLYSQRIVNALWLPVLEVQGTEDQTSKSITVFKKNITFENKATVIHFEPNSISLHCFVSNYYTLILYTIWLLMHWSLPKCTQFSENRDGVDCYKAFET